MSTSPSSSVLDYSDLVTGERRDSPSALFQIINNKQMNVGEADGDWESLLDSGQLDDNIKKLTILPRPKPPVQQSSLSRHEDPRREVEVICSEEDGRTPFKPSDPVIKIMKRPDKSRSPRGHAVQTKPRTEQKSLKQREQEYAEARQRILGRKINISIFQVSQFFASNCEKY